MRFNAHHGLYRKHRELTKILIRKINAICEVKLTPKRKFRHISYRDKAKQHRMFSLRMGVAAMIYFLIKEKEGGKQ